MATQQLTRAPQKFSVAIQGEGYKRLIANTLTDPKRAARFVANVSAAVATNPALQKCDPGTILSAALVGESLNLSPSPQLGQFYMVPFNDRRNNRTVATFVLGYKGYVQMALRTGQYRKLNVIALKAGELVRWNPMTEDAEVRLMEDEEARENADTTHYYGMFEYVNGFRKAICWSREKMMYHADRYSKAFSAKEYAKLLAGEIPEADLWKYSSFWYKDFDGMALKTILRQLIGKWGLMSTELQVAFERDDTFAAPDEAPQFVSDNDISELRRETSEAVSDAAGDAPPPPAPAPAPDGEPEDADAIF